MEVFPGVVHEVIDWDSVINELESQSPFDDYFRIYKFWKSMYSLIHAGKV